MRSSNLSMKKKPTLAFGVLAHKNVCQLNVFVEQLLSYEGSYVFIHIDKKAQVDAADVIVSDRVVIVPKRIDVAWADITIVDATLLLMRSIIEHEKQFDWISIHSGLDLAVRPMVDFAEYLKDSTYMGYIESTPLPIFAWGRMGGIDRVQLSYPKYLRQRPKRYGIVWLMLHVYRWAFAHKLIGVQQRASDLEYFGGSNWFTLQIDVVANLLKYLDNHKEYRAHFANVLHPDEIFFQTLINKIYSSKKISLNYTDNLRYIDWSGTRKSEMGAPATLTSDDIKEIETSGKFFARKFDISVDMDVIQYYRNRINISRKNSDRK